MKEHWASSSGWVSALWLTLLVCVANASARTPHLQIEADSTTGRRLADAPRTERETLGAFLQSESWARRAIGVVRLQRFACEEASELLMLRLQDPSWRVRVFTVVGLGQRGEPAVQEWLTTEEEPRVLRAALRCGYSLPADRLSRGVNYLSRQSSPSDRLLAVELAVASNEAELERLARETIRKVITRLDRPTAGVLSPRLAALTGTAGPRSPRRWQSWWRKNGHGTTLQQRSLVQEDQALSPIAALSSNQFANLHTYMEELHQRQVDLAVCLDTTASMSGELASAQGGIDDLMHFGNAVLKELRIGIVAYRDRRNRYETKGWDFTTDLATARQRLWQLTAEEGGDSPEAVYPALRSALYDLSWEADNFKTLVLIGDGPPHPGYGGKCVDLMGKAHERAELITHTIRTEDREVKHFAEIAEAGQGQAVHLKNDAALIPQITGLTLGQRFREELIGFFWMYLTLCR